jgi:hypothetical protein
MWQALQGPTVLNRIWSLRACKALLRAFKGAPELCCCVAKQRQNAAQAVMIPESAADPEQTSCFPNYKYADRRAD